MRDTGHGIDKHIDRQTGWQREKDNPKDDWHKLHHLLLHWIGGLFVAVVCINYAANIVQEMVVGRVAGSLLFDLRRAMYEHLQHVSLSFMDKTEVGRLMSRLQGDVGALQEFLETSIFAIGDLVLLLGIIGVMLWLDPWLGLLTLSVVPILFLVRLIWLPYAKQAFLHARETQSSTNGALAENVHGIRTIQGLGREQVNFELYTLKAQENLRAHLRASKFSNGLIPIVDQERQRDDREFPISVRKEATPRALQSPCGYQVHEFAFVAEHAAEVELDLDSSVAAFFKLILEKLHRLAAALPPKADFGADQGGQAIQIRSEKSTAGHRHRLGRE